MNRFPVALFAGSALLLSACLQGNTVVPIEEPNMAGAADWGPLMARTGCSGFNALLFADSSAMAPFVPPNWTFTAFQSQGMLRVHVAGCDRPDATEDEPWDFHLVLSTPMQPDEASVHHHDNPDVVLGIWSDNATTVAAWNAAGVPAHDATFDWSETTSGDTVDVVSEDGDVMAFEGVNPHQPLPTGRYVWPAAYASGISEIVWFWGHENATSRTASVLPPTFGAGSPIPGLSTTPWSVQVWMGFDVAYALGTPPR